MEEFKIIKYKITADNIKDFCTTDKRVSRKDYWEEVDYLKKQIVKNKDIKNYDLTVFNYDWNYPFCKITDGSHRLKALIQLFNENKIKEFDVYLLPEINLGGISQKIAMSKKLDELLEKEGLPKSVKKFSFT